ncbi:MAG: membrane protein insertion efficiency factor YidD [Ruminococcus sp.]
MKYICIALIKFYRRFISPVFPPCCKYYPTCSQYALEAFRKFGFFRGFLLAFWRILRCNPWSLGGIDPVPEKFTFKSGRN